MLSASTNGVILLGFSALMTSALVAYVSYSIRLSKSPVALRRLLLATFGLINLVARSSMVGGLPHNAALT